MPREKYDGQLLIRGGGAYYSFAKLTNDGTDIGFEQGRLGLVFAGANFGFLASLGDVPVDGVTIDDRGVLLLAAFRTPSTEAEAREQQRRASAGFEADGFAYRRDIPASVNTTYVVRSINYDVSDVLVVLRVTRQDADGSLILAWKMLSRFSMPHLISSELGVERSRLRGGR